MEFEDFAIKIEAGAEGEHRVFVLASPAGEDSGVFRFPFDVDPHRFGRVLQGGAYRHLLLTGGPAAPAEPEAVGDALFRALFSGPVLHLYEDSRRRLAPEGGLRLRLHLDPESPGLEPVCRLPWELLHEKERGFLALCPRSLFSRHLDLPVTTMPVLRGRPLRVLVIMAQPADVAPLDLGIERGTLESAWRGLKGVELRFLEKATRERLREALAAEEHHVLHFMGHGDIDPESQEGALLLERPGGESEVLPGSELVRLLEDRSLPALVVLNACRTAEGSRAADAFAGVAGTLVKAGILAVVAMQESIRDQAALAFGKALYRRLADGDPVDAAVTAGRRAIQDVPGTAAEWSIPVLFLRRRDGRIFDPVQVPPREKETAWRLARTLSEARWKRFLAALDPGGAPTFETVLDVCEAAARSGGEDWRRCTEVLLAVRSPLLLFSGPREEWRPRPRSSWEIEGDDVVGVGGDGGALSWLLWEGLQLRDGFVEAHVDIPLLDIGGGAGLALRWTDGSAVLGVLVRGAPETGGARAEILRLLGDRRTVLGSLAIPGSDTTWKVRLSVAGRRATLDVDGTPVEVDLEMAPVPGSAGLVRLDGAFARFGRPAVGVADLDSDSVFDSTRRSP